MTVREGGGRKGNRQTLEPATLMRLVDQVCMSCYCHEQSNLAQIKSDDVHVEGFLYFEYFFIGLIA